jgi:flagellar biosynthetic protein FliR
VTQATLNQLLRGVLGPGTIVGFFLVLARVSPLFIVAPLFSSKMVPRQVRGLVGVGLAVGLTGVATKGQHLPTAALPIAALLIEELVVGLGFALIVSVVFASLQMAGSLTVSLAGFSFGSQVDPINGNQGGVITQLYSVVGLMIFITIGGDAWILRGIARTFALVPLTRGPKIGPLVGGALEAFGTIFVSGIEVAAPALLAILITDVAFGMISRVMPQLNVFAVAFPMKIGIGLLVVSASLPFLGGWISDEIATSVGTALHSLGVA